MGVKGHVRLVEEDRGWLSGKKMRLERHDGSGALPEEEAAALDDLCRPGEEVMMEQENHAIFASAKNSLSEVLKTNYEGKAFKRNYGWAAAGLFLFVALFWLTCAAVDAATIGSYGWQIGVVFGALITTGLLWLAFHGSAVGKCLLSLVGFVALSTAFVLGMPVFADALNTGWYLPLVLPLLALPLVISAFWWISAPTAEGRAILDHIAGFRQYLSITEAERLDRMTPPRDTPEIFERYLALRDRAGRRESLGRALRRRACRGGRAGPGTALAGIRAAAARGAIRRVSPTAWDRPCRARSARPRPRRDRAAARAAADRRAAAAVAAVAEAGDQLQAGRFRTTVGLS